MTVLYCMYLYFGQGLRSVMADEGYVVRIRGLPWSCSVDEVQRFFSGKHSFTQKAEIFPYSKQ